jgi:hypothetical protein
MCEANEVGALKHLRQEAMADYLEAGRVWTSDEIREKLGMSTGSAFIA